MSLSLNKHSILGTLSYNQVDQNWTDVETLVNQINSRLPQNNWQATVNPTASNDQTQGYVAGSRWYNRTSGDLFICTSAATGAAVWVAETTLTFADVTLDAVTSAGNSTTNAMDVGELRSSDWVGTVVNGGLGHVAEYGSNANGSFVRLSGGLLLMRRTISHDASVTTAVDYTFPAAYAGDRPVCGFSGLSGALGLTAMGNAICVAGLASWNLRVQSTVVGATAYPVGLIAIGRWF